MKAGQKDGLVVWMVVSMAELRVVVMAAWMDVMSVGEKAVQTGAWSVVCWVVHWVVPMVATMCK